MSSRSELVTEVMRAARDQGMSAVLFRNAVGRRLGLSVTESEALSLLGIKGTSSPTELARYTGLTSGATTSLLDRLEAAGLIRRLPNPQDRRGVLIEINKQYRETAGPLVAGVQKAHQKLLAGYSERELETIAGFLRRFTKNVTEQTQEIEKNEDLHGSSR